MKQYEEMQYIHKGEDIILRPGKEATFVFDMNDMNEEKMRFRLYFRGETVLSYMWMGEPDMERQYMQIEDALDTEHAWQSQYCLDFSQEKPVPWTKRIVKKSVWPPRLSCLELHSYSDVWNVGVSIKARNLQVKEGGFLRILVDCWNKVDGRAKEHTNGIPDSRMVIEIPTGTYDWMRLEKEMVIPSDTTACVIYTLECMGYEGNLYVESPFMISSNGYNILPEFGTSVQTQVFFDWLGENMSKKEWPEFLVYLNGNVIYEGELFARCHRYPEFSIELPENSLRNQDNRLTVRLITKGHDPLPIKLHDVAIVSTERGRFTIVGYPRFVFKGSDFPVLIRTEQENTLLSLEGEDVYAKDSLALPEKGLHVLRFGVKEDKTYGVAQFAIVGFEEVHHCSIHYLPKRPEDNVITGSGDMIYIQSDSLVEMEHYLCWYISNRIGKLMTIRPAYLWGGGRYANTEVWKLFQRILNAMDMKYAHIVDGRDLPGISANPSPAMLEGKGFLGRQLHERDGQLLYWRCPTSEYSPTIQEFFDLAQRKYVEAPENTEPLFDPKLIRMEAGKYCLLRDHDMPRDMEIVGKAVVEELKAIRRNYLRHSGPSVAFKYFYQAGFNWTSAELMGSTFEITSSFLRGASGAYGVNQFGVHLALQWSTTPHDTPERIRRYRLALYVAYMHGISEINTEEGFWHLEHYFSYYDRFSVVCKNHLLQQKDFSNYVNLHSRTGKFYTPIAFVHGRYDGWIGFEENKLVWGMPHIQSGEAEQGWEVLRAVYPLNRINKSLYIDGCPTEAVGFYSGTPLGCADVIPAEAGDYERYRLIIFAGYHKAEMEDVVKLVSFLQKGGVLITGWAYLSDTTNRDDVDEYRHHYLDFPGVLAQPVFVEDSFCGKTVWVADKIPQGAEVVVRTDSGNALVYELVSGEGRLLFVNAREYAGNIALTDLWEELIRKQLKQIVDKESCWIYCGEDVEFTVYDQEDGSRIFYVLAVDWYHEPDCLRTVTLRVGDFTYQISVKFGVMLKILVKGNTAVWADTEDVELRSLGDNCVEIIGLTECDIHIASNGVEKTEHMSGHWNCIKL